MFPPVYRDLTGIMPQQLGLHNCRDTGMAGLRRKSIVERFASGLCILAGRCPPQPSNNHRRFRRMGDFKDG
jgi:hypothetical protein